MTWGPLVGIKPLIQWSPFFLEEGFMAPNIRNDNSKSEVMGNVLKLGAYITATLITVILTMVGFWLMEGREFVTRNEALELIQTENKIILERMDARDRNEQRLENVLEKNTEAIQQLKVQIATLNSTLEFIESRSSTTHVHSPNAP